MGVGPALSPPADRALSAHSCFIQCIAACSLLSRDESALQCAPLASAEAVGGTASLRESPVSVTAASPAAPAPAGAVTLRDQTPPCSSGPLVPPVWAITDEIITVEEELGLTANPTNKVQDPVHSGVSSASEVTPTTVTMSDVLNPHIMDATVHYTKDLLCVRKKPRKEEGQVTDKGPVGSQFP
ncbi:hypothetical protein NDU88_004737 [Pleurodeles waltl]|uniref:Uncharacterized protein n=1 Tax=Pleurodeles waltl TaxID=8319 RepID=A0AAV7VJ28_PLEWA|nr:hypothetical protein NDU88_004737 [Pleurodeles waltl]